MQEKQIGEVELVVYFVLGGVLSQPIVVIAISSKRHPQTEQQPWTQMKRRKGHQYHTLVLGVIMFFFYLTTWIFPWESRPIEPNPNLLNEVKDENWRLINIQDYDKLNLHGIFKISKSYLIDVLTDLEMRGWIELSKNDIDETVGIQVTGFQCANSGCSGIIIMRMKGRESYSHAMNAAKSFLPLKIGDGWNTTASNSKILLVQVDHVVHVYM